MKWKVAENNFIVDECGNIIAGVPCQGVPDAKKILLSIVRDHHAIQVLESLTPGGSDYVGDVEKCAEYLRWIKTSCVEANKSVVRIKKNRAEAFEAMRNKLADVLEDFESGYVANHSARAEKRREAHMTSIKAALALAEKED